MGLPETYPKEIPLASITPDERAQPRVEGISERHVNELVKGSEPEGWPPVLVAQAPGGLHALIDGFHRYEAARRLGLASIPANVTPRQAGYVEAFEANASHGLPLNRADRKTYARHLRAQEPGLSLREIGRRSGLSHNTVKAALEESGGGQFDQSGISAGPRGGRDPLAAAVKRLDVLADDGYRQRNIKSGASEYIEGFEDEADRISAAKNFMLWAAALSKAAEPYL